MDQLVADKRLTAAGRDWLVLSLDPFHDLNHQTAGYPDADGSQTLVSCYQYQTDIVAPAGVAGNWDAHVYTLPLSNSQGYTLGSELADWSSIAELATSPARLQGPLNIVTGPSGSTLIPIAPSVPNTEFATLPATNNTDLIAGVTRIIGMGYEVTNTTAEISKQGAVTSYRMPQYASEASSLLVTNATGTQKATAPGVRWRMPPTNAAAANILKGTRTWDAASGVYATAVLNSVHNPLKLASTSLTVFENQPFSGAVSQVMYSPYLTANSNTSPVPSLISPYPGQTTPFDTTGSIFTGLSNATTLTVKVKFYVERAPTMAEPALAVLATPSAGLDNTALELYSHAISQLPVAVTVAENGLGDWFKGVVRVVRDVAGVAAPIVGAIHPGAGLAAASASAVLGRMDSFLHKQNRMPSVTKQALAVARAVAAAPQRQPPRQQQQQQQRKKQQQKQRPQQAPKKR